MSPLSLSAKSNIKQSLECILSCLDRGGGADYGAPDFQGQAALAGVVREKETADGVSGQKRTG